MAEIRRGSDGAPPPDRLPWLEPVEQEEDFGYPGTTSQGYGGVILAAVAVLAAIAVLTGAALWYRHHRAQTADIGQVIQAPAGPYKERPSDPGGMKEDKAGEVASSTSAGQDLDSPIDLGAMPEQPVAGARQPAPAPAPPPQLQAPAQPQSPARIQPQPQPQPHQEASVPAKPAPKPAAPKPAPVETARAVEEPAPHVAGGGTVIQLGAFSSEAKARSAWKSLSGRFGFLGAMTESITPVTAGDKTLYRLRASGGGNAGQLCARLHVAGESCAVAG